MSRRHSLTVGLSGVVCWLVLAGAAQAEPLTGTGCVEMGLHGDHAMARQQAQKAGIADALRRTHVPDPQTGADLVIVVPREKMPGLLKRGWLGPVETLRERERDQDLCVTVQFTLDAETKAELARLYGQRSGPSASSVPPVAGSHGPAPLTPIASVEDPQPTVDQPQGPSGTTRASATALSPATFTVGSRVWLSQGRYAFNFGNVGGPNVVSELAWQGQNLPIYELNADLVWRRLLATVAGGYGSFNKGTLRDQDWNGDNRTQLASDTLSPTTGGTVWYVTIDVGSRLVAWRYAGQTGSLDLLAGFQYWREKSSAFGIIDNFPGGRDTPTSVNVITETVQWRNLRLGPRTTIPVHSRVQVTGSLLYIPYSSFELEDVHHLRDDLAQNPSGRALATGGAGVQFEAAVRLLLWRGLMLEGGYRYWDMRMGSGTINIFGSDGSVSAQPFNQANARRQGVFVSLLWKF